MALARRRFLAGLGALLVPVPALAYPRIPTKVHARRWLVLGYRSRWSDTPGNRFDTIRRLLVDGPALVLAALAPYDLVVEEVDALDGRGWASIDGETVIRIDEGGLRPRLLAARLQEEARLRVAADLLERDVLGVADTAEAALRGEELADADLLDASATIALRGGSTAARRALQRVGEAMRRSVRETPPHGCDWTEWEVAPSCVGDGRRYPTERLVADAEQMTIDCGMARMDGRSREFLAWATGGRPA